MSQQTLQELLRNGQNLSGLLKRQEITLGRNQSWEDLPQHRSDSSRTAKEQQDTLRDDPESEKEKES